MSVHFELMKESFLPYLGRRWLAVWVYLLILLIVTPYLPLLINWSRRRWAAGSVSGFVLGLEISLGILLLLFASSIFFFNKGKFLLCILIIGILIGISSLYYFLNPNPYELTHLPEYAILSILISHAIKAGEAKRRHNVNGTSFYIRPAAITIILGAIDELYQGVLPLRYFDWYDIVMNGLGGILGLTIFWGINRE